MQKISSRIMRIAATLLVAVMLSSSVPALGRELTYLEKEQQIDFANACLTELYGYLAEETEKFVYEQICQDGIATLRYWPEGQPNWVYTCTFSLTNGERLSATSPFIGYGAGYPGENSIRCFLRELTDRQLLAHWDKNARATFRTLLEQEDIRPGAALEKGLLSATYTPQQALLDLFIGFYDVPAVWPQAVTEWFEQLLEVHGLEKPAEQKPEAGITRYRCEAQPPYVLTEFVLTTPPELAEAFAHPKLEGWTVFSGAFVTFEESAEDLRKQGELGLAVFAKGEERILCALHKQQNNGKWLVEPVSTTVLPLGSEPVVSRSDPLSTGLSRRYQIVFEHGSYQDVIMQVELDWQLEEHMLCHVRSYSFTDAASGERYNFSSAYGNLRIDRCAAGEGNRNELDMLSYFPTVVTYMNACDIPELCLGLNNDPAEVVNTHLPEGTVVLGGVHLRKETSSRSKDLGMLRAGTIARKLGVESGDPNPWYHVEIGSMTGYVSGAYVDEEYGHYAQACLPVARTLKEISLKEHTGLFAADTAHVPEGCTMHVIMQDGDWLYVCIPQNQPAAMRMDPDGAFGWIRAEAVLLGATALSLEWQLSELTNGQ